MSEFLDLRAFVRQLAVENFLAEEDGITGDYGPNNFYRTPREDERVHVHPVGQEQHVLGDG